MSAQELKCHLLNTPQYVSIRHIFADTPYWLDMLHKAYYSKLSNKIHNDTFNLLKGRYVFRIPNNMLTSENSGH
jgi:hypothetical protein